MRLLLIAIISVFSFGAFGQCATISCDSLAVHCGFAKMDELPGTMEIIESSLSPSDIHNNGALVQFSGETRADQNWSRANNIFSYAGTPDIVEVNFNIHALDTGASNYWARPKLRVLKNGVIDFVIDALAMQDNTAYDGAVTFTGEYKDVNPGLNPIYTFEWFDNEARTATLTPESFSRITLNAIQ